MEYKGMKKNSGIIPLPPETQGLITELATRTGVCLPLHAAH